MRVAILHNELTAGAAADELDVLAQAGAVGRALADLGHEASVLTCGLDLGAVRDRLAELRPDTVFNLVEGLAGHGRLIAAVPYLLEALGVPQAGCPADAIHTTGHKVLAKRMLAAAGLPTAAWLGPDGSAHGQGGDRWIVKSVWEDASLGMDDAAVTGGGPAAAAALLAARADRPGAPWFAEAFVEGREFNLGLLDGPGGPTVLPPAEIVFRDFPPDKPRIVGYAAKWDEGSFEFDHTVRVFPDRADDGALIGELEDLARACWTLFGLRGWARVDFRVDENGRPFILEVNANPCISPDAGFAAGLARAGIAYADAVGRIVAAAG
ncbi:MAG TPA: D-alanine--D-alanine ligase [Candidatus Krumholzibacteria bacterium]|nr:D-alanine--D-alanine ligase [Candidatus Krumholzibacteria bacterium]